MSLSNQRDFASYVHQYHSSGFLTYQDSGEVGRVCADNLNLQANAKAVLNKLGESTCNLLEYQELVNIEIIQDEESELGKSKYVDISAPMSASKNFINAPCLKR